MTASIYWECYSYPNFIASCSYFVSGRCYIDDPERAMETIQQAAVQECARRGFFPPDPNSIRVSGINNTRADWYEAFPRQKLQDEWDTMIYGRPVRYSFADDIVLPDPQRPPPDSWWKTIRNMLFWPKDATAP